MKRRAGLTLVEVLVTIGIMAVLLGLVAAAIMQVREVALRAESQNNLKQIVLAVHQYGADRSGRLPRINGGNDEDGSLFFVLLPYLEHGNYYEEVKANLRGFGDVKIRNFLSPADPSLDHSGDTGFSSYAANARAFAGEPPLTTPGPNGQVTFVYRGVAGMGEFRDGASSTIMFAEHYAWPKKHGPITHTTQFSWFLYLEPYQTPPFTHESVTYQITSRRATFADASCGDVYPVRNGGQPGSVGSVRGLTFQVRPRIEDCDPRIPQTPHPGGMLAAMADGSVRTLAKGMSETAFWSAVTPAGGEALGDDW